MSGLATAKSQDNAPKLSADELRSHMAQVQGWKQQGDAIAKTFNFKNYYETMAFANAVAWIAHQQNHHPDMEVGYNKCTLRYSTHSAGGLTKNDFICAARVEQLMKS
jgi:4a-hydroxytetrahydrobiopterin dehydratase